MSGQTLRGPAAGPEPPGWQGYHNLDCLAGLEDRPILFSESSSADGRMTASTTSWPSRQSISAETAIVLRTRRGDSAVYPITFRGVSASLVLTVVRANHRAGGPRDRLDSIGRAAYAASPLLNG